MPDAKRNDGNEVPVNSIAVLASLGAFRTSATFHFHSCPKLSL